LRASIRRTEADAQTKARLVEEYLVEHTPAEQRSTRHPGCTKVQARKLSSMMNPPEEVIVFENWLKILGWTVDGDVIVGWYCDSYDEASVTPSTWRERAAFVRVTDDEASDLKALYAFR
jgi:hypothetical protein